MELNKLLEQANEHVVKTNKLIKSVLNICAVMVVCDRLTKGGKVIDRGRVKSI